MKIEKLLMTLIVTTLTALTLLACLALMMYKDFSDNYVGKIVHLDCKDSMVCYKDPESRLYCVIKE